jgi:hypothetical protein
MVTGYKHEHFPIVVDGRSTCADPSKPAPRALTALMDWFKRLYVYSFLQLLSRVYKLPKHYKKSVVIEDMVSLPGL